MPSARHSRHRRGEQQSEFLDRLLTVLKFVLDRATGRKPRRGGGESPPHRARSRTLDGSRGHSAHAPWTRKSIGVPGLILGLCIVLVLGWVAWRIIADTAAQSLTRSAPAEAISLVPNEAAALDELAQQQLIGPDPDIDAARAYAEAALKANPLDDRALVMLGFIADRKGDRKSADAIAKLAGERSWRNPVTQLWLFQRNVRDGEFASAMMHADAMMRVNGNNQALLFRTLAAFVMDDRTIGPLVATLETSPPWRQGFLRNVSASLADETRLRKLFSLLTQSKSPPTKEELSPYLSRLVKDGNYIEAHQIWLATLPPAERTSDVHPYNADFTEPLDGMPFNWVLASSAGSDIQIVKPEGFKRPVLQIQFSGARIKPIEVGQLMLLAPGRYRLSGKVTTEDLRTQRGLWWKVSCAAQPAKELAHTDLVSGNIPWQDFAATFEVPTEGCAAQRLQLELPARIPSETQIAGQALYQGLRITALTNEPPQGQKN